jgi:hypothetical protein
LTEAALNPAVDRFEGLDEADQEDFKSNLETFLRVYSFQSDDGRGCGRQRRLRGVQKVAFAPVFLDTIINQMDANEEIFKPILADDRMRGLFVEFIGRSVYDQIRAR